MINGGSSEVIDADPEDPLRITISSRPSREGGFRKSNGLRLLKPRNVIQHDYSMYEPKASMPKKASISDFNQKNKPPLHQCAVMNNGVPCSKQHRHSHTNSGVNQNDFTKFAAAFDNTADSSLIKN
jgi:hypothetical protein